MLKAKSVVVAITLIVLASRAEASPIKSVQQTYHVLLGTASALSLSSLETNLSARAALLASGLSLPLQTLSIGPTGAPGAVQATQTMLLASSVAAPLPPAFHEPSAWVIVLFGLGLVALGSVRWRR